MTEPTILELTEHEVNWIRSEIRMDYRKKLRGREKAAAQWGDGFDATASDRKLEFLLALYKKLTPGTTGAQFLNEVLTDTETR